MNKIISVIIPTYNSWETLKLCIESIQKQTLQPLEIIVIDNASTDSTSKNVKKHFPKVKLVTLNKNTGVTGGRNAGIQAASKESKFIFLFDHDMIAKKEMLQELLDVAENNNNIGIVTPKIYYWEDKTRIWSAGTSMNLWTGQVIFRGGQDNGQYEEDVEIDVAPAAMLIRKEVIKSVGLFDDKYFAVYEDTDYCFRAKDKGYKIYYAPQAVAYHMLSTSKKDEADRLLGRARWVGRNRVLFMKDFGKSMFIFTLFQPIFWSYYLFMAVKYKRMKEFVKFLDGVIEGYQYAG